MTEINLGNCHWCGQPLHGKTLSAEPPVVQVVCTNEKCCCSNLGKGFEGYGISAPSARHEQAAEGWILMSEDVPVGKTLVWVLCDSGEVSTGYYDADDDKWYDLTGCYGLESNVQMWSPMKPPPLPAALESGKQEVG